MFVLFFIWNIVLLTMATEQESVGFINGVNVRDNRGLSNAQDTFNKPVMLNSTYVDKEENVLRVPNNYYDESKTKKKIKKTPKRTVQKIIKNNKLKSRKLYLYPATLMPTLPSKSNHHYEDELLTKAAATTENNWRKRTRKNSKYVRYPMPFQKLQKRDGHRYKREDRDLYILKDFDEMEFLSNEKDHDKVLTHVQKYW